ncbi:hypothetical protein C5167_000068 [Papaver somniferum]|uniref:B30.2/SPRY domain-containing protein n=1 Tax=Papaver somniferum TaxID=3469 RepID=A0A4Y7KUD1_PAPSO|nr:protein TRAUCO-like [Papaver somniferum]RZC75960.1 hypothetical protein C5167_000068 [Papaver somniferum]
MENLIRYNNDEDTDDTSGNNNNHVPRDKLTPNETLTPISEAIVTENNINSSPNQEVKEKPEISVYVELNIDENLTQYQQLSSEKVTTTLSDDEDDDNPRKKRRSLTSFTDNDQLEEEEESKKSEQTHVPSLTAPTVKKAKKKTSKANSVWTKPTSRKGKKKNNNRNVVSAAEDTVLITPFSRFPDKTDDSVDMKICLSKVYKDEKIELSEDRLSAGSTKGYRMVRATRGVVEGAWYFEIRVTKIGETGHTRLGWSSDKGDIHAPVGYDEYSFGYRDVDGSKIHKALREKYGEEGYVEGDVIGCYINLPQGGLYAPKPVHLFWYKGQKYSSTLEEKDKEEAAKVVPGSEICFFKNGILQGVAFKDLSGGRYYPAASMYTLPNQPNCTVKFNFGPDFEFFPQEFEDRPVPTAMIEVPYQQVDARIENGESVGK